MTETPANEKYSIADVARIVESEGLGYAVQHYMGADSIEDLQLAGLWATAKTALDAIDAILDDAEPDEGEPDEDDEPEGEQ